MKYYQALRSYVHYVNFGLYVYCLPFISFLVFSLYFYLDD